MYPQFDAYSVPTGRLLQDWHLTVRITGDDVFAHRSFVAQKTFRHRGLYKEKLSYRAAFTHTSFYTENNFSQFVLHTKLLQTGVFTQRNLCTEQLHTLENFTQSSFYTQMLLHREAFTHSRLYAQFFLHREAFMQSSFTQSSFYAQKLLHGEDSLHREAFTQRSFFSHRSI